MKPGKKKIIGMLALAAIFTLGTAVPAYADNDPVLADGNFDGPWNPAPFRYETGTSFGAWNVVGGDASLGPGGPGPSTGVFLEHYDPPVVDFATDSPTPYLSGIGQTFPSTPGSNYTLTFWVQGEGVLEVWRDGTTVDSFSATAAGAWHSTSFVATSSLTSLVLQSYIPVPAPNNYNSVFIDTLLVLPDSPMVEPVIGTAAAGAALVFALGWGAHHLVRRRRLLELATF